MTRKIPLTVLMAVLTATAVVAGVPMAGAGSTADVGDTGAVTTDVTVSETWRTQVDTYFQPAQNVGAAGVVYSINNGTVDALDADTGQRLWEKRVGGDFPIGAVDEQGTLYVAASGFIVAFEKDTGTVRWNESIDATPQGLSNGRIYATSGNTIQAIDAQDGSILWTRDTDETPQIRGVDAQAETLITTEETYDGVVRTGSKITAWDGTTGEEQWTNTYDTSIQGTTFVNSGTVYAIEGGNLTQLDIDSGDETGSATLAGQTPRSSSITISGDRLYGTIILNGTERLVGYDTNTGEQVANATAADGSFPNMGTPVLAGDRVYILDINAGLRVFDAGNGTQIGAGGTTDIGSPVIMDGAAFYSTGAGGGESGHDVVRVDIGSAGEGGGSDDPIAEYADDQGVVTATGLLEAASDFRNGEIEATLLLEVASAFRSGNPVS